MRRQMRAHRRPGEKQGRWSCRRPAAAVRPSGTAGAPGGATVMRRRWLRRLQRRRRSPQRQRPKQVQDRQRACAVAGRGCRGRQRPRRQQAPRLPLGRLTARRQTQAGWCTCPDAGAEGRAGAAPAVGAGVAAAAAVGNPRAAAPGLREPLTAAGWVAGCWARWAAGSLGTATAATAAPPTGVPAVRRTRSAVAAGAAARARTAPVGGAAAVAAGRGGGGGGTGRRRTAMVAGAEAGAGARAGALGEGGAARGGGRVCSDAGGPVRCAVLVATAAATVSAKGGIQVPKTAAATQMGLMRLWLRLRAVRAARDWAALELQGPAASGRAWHLASP